MWCKQNEDQYEYEYEYEFAYDYEYEYGTICLDTKRNDVIEYDTDMHIT